MTLQIRPAPVRKSITVNADAARAFEVFAGRIGSWWPHTHTIGSSPQKNIVLEPRAGGRWFERATDGTICLWGHVQVWDPPSRLVLLWQIGSNWKYDDDFSTEIEVRFVTLGPAQTRIEFEHRQLERFGEKADAQRQTMDGGWGSILELYKARTQAAADVR